MNAVTVIKDYAESLGFEFHYGGKEVLNLLRSDSTIGKMYFLLLSPLKFSTSESVYSIGDDVVKGGFMLLVKSNLDNTVYRERGQNEQTGKYMKNVVPLLQKLKEFDDGMACENFIYTRQDAIDVYNLFDMNTDGVLVESFTLEEL